MNTYRKKYVPFSSPLDPCKPLPYVTYETPPQLYLGFQPPRLAQYTPRDALRKGTLWKALYAPYTNPYQAYPEMKREANEDESV
ncbi:spore coat associated protein CotJA [Marinicrinis sediminis]|uniref:Spore coat associated protein CotJA n=1 Tax=Marinicrinis sediminis TaxID=1652465 RepID=A0ABW5RFG5_9BACL